MIPIELACQWSVFWLSAQATWRALARWYSSKTQHNHRGTSAYSPLYDGKTLVHDPASEEDQVKMWMWLPGLLGVLILTCVVMYVQYGMPVTETCLALLLTFFFSFLAIQATGATGT